jgi:hypothetical protein
MMVEVYLERCRIHNICDVHRPHHYCRLNSSRRPYPCRRYHRYRPLGPVSRKKMSLRAILSRSNPVKAYRPLIGADVALVLTCRSLRVRPLTSRASTRSFAVI